MSWLRENWFKLACLGVILVIGLGFVNYLNVKESNRQNEEEKRWLQEQLDADRRFEAENKKYSADRKSDCLKIYQAESEKWNNVKSWDYIENNDTCFVSYEERPRKTEEECNESYPVGGDWGFSFFFENSLCKDGVFRKSF